LNHPTMLRVDELVSAIFKVVDAVVLN